MPAVTPLETHLFGLTMLPACNMVKVPWEEVGIYREEMGVDLEEVDGGGLGGDRREL